MKKIREIKFVINYPHNENIYYDLLIKLDGLMTNYHDYMTTEPIACDEEVKELSNVNWDLTCALLTMILREDH